MSALPKSYKDPYWTALADNTGEKLGLPAGLLSAIITRGERSNADQVSEAGAKTPFQIIPATRKAAIDKYGIDPYLSPENAAEVAGLLLKDSLARNKGDVATAVAEYHGGTDKANWGPRTRAYVARVVGGQALEQQAAQPNQPMQGQSTFQRVAAKMAPINSSAIASVYDAYKSGKMAPQDAAEFEQDVKSGVVMLPRGATLNGTQPPSADGGVQATMLPSGVTEAYYSGKMSPQDKQELEADIKSGLVKLPPRATDMIPGDANWVPPTEHVTAQQLQNRPQDPSLMQKAVGAGEAALSTVTGMTGGALGMAAGATGQIAKNVLNGTFGTQQAAQLVENAAAGGAEQFTYAPRTATGQQYTENVGQVMQQLIPAAPLTGEMGMAAAAAQRAAPAVRAAAAPVVAGARRAAQVAGNTAMGAVQSVKNAPGRAMEMVGLKAPAEAAPTSVGGSVGAAALPADAVRAAKAENLPVPIELTKGAETRNAAQLAFEKEQMKSPTLGAPLRQRAEENNLQALQNFDELIDRTNAQAPDISATGNKVVDALAEGWKAAKNKTRIAYEKADKSPEAQAAVDPNTVVTIGEGEQAVTGSLVDYINSKVRGLPSAAVTDTAREYLVKMGMAQDENGVLVGKPTTIAQMEKFRQELNKTADLTQAKQVRDETIIKKIIDAQTEPAAGPLYKEARALRTQQGRKYENRAIVARLITNRKGMDNPKVAVDQVFQKSVLNGSPEEITFLKRVLTTSGENGKQAWQELQGATLKHIRDEATSGMGMDSFDRPLVSPDKLNRAVSSLDKNGRLDIVLGKQKAEVIRDLNDVVKYVNTAPPGTLVNNSGTTGALLAAIGEAGTVGALTGLPVPVLSILRALNKEIQNNKVRQKITHALNAKPKKKEF